MLTSASSLMDMLDRLDWGVYRLNGAGRLVEANAAMLDMLGMDKPATAFFHSATDRTRLFTDSVWAHYDAQIRHAGQIAAFETELIRTDGLMVPVLLTAQLLRSENGKPDGSQGIAIDMTRHHKREKALKAANSFMQEKLAGYESIIADQYPRRQMAKELKKAHDLLDNIIHSSPNIIIVTDLKGRIIIANTVAQAVLGCRFDNGPGNIELRRLYPDGVVNEIMERMRGPEPGSRGRLTSYPIRYLNSDGLCIEGNLSAAMLYDDRGQEIGCVHIIVDLTEHLAMERQLRQTQKQLLQSEKLAAMGRLTSQIAHEINNPLYGIMNTFELLKTEIPPGSKRRKILQMAISETERLSELLRKMLSFSKPDQQEQGRVNINRVIEELLLLLQKQLVENNIRIQTDLTETAGTVYASVSQLRQVFLNMIANAKDAMPEGGLLKISTESQNGMVLVTIADNGTGIHPDHLDKIFDAFFTTKDSVKGVGLGLSVCYGVIKEHRGMITVQSHINQGTAFTIHLPAHPATG